MSPKPPTGCQRSLVRYGYHMWYALANMVFWTQLEPLWLLNIEFAVARTKGTDGFIHHAVRLLQ